MKRTSSLIFLFTFFLLFFSVLSACANALTVDAKANDLSTIDILDIQVDHTVQIKDGGLVVINDTVRLSAPPDENIGLLQNFPIGFPFKYSFNLDHCFAYDASNPNERLRIIPDVGLGERIGFYGMNVILNISDVKSYNFTAVFVFSNLIYSKNELVLQEIPSPGEPPSFENKTYFYSDFPTYPSLTQNASICNVTIILPSNVYVSNSSHKEWLAASGVLNHIERNLRAFAYEEPVVLRTSVLLHEPPVTYEEKALLKLGTEVGAPPDAFTVISADEIKRDITLDEWGHVLLSDSYYLTNEGGSFRPMVHLPQGAYDVSAWDESGSLTVDVEKGNATSCTNATIYKDIDHGESARFTVSYQLPREIYIKQESWRDFDLAFSFFEHFNWTIRKLIVTTILPEGAEFQRSSVDPQSVKKSVFQETTVFTFYNVTPFHDLNFDLTYRYVMFWVSFRPTLWMGVLIAIICVVVFLWRAPKPPPAPIIPVPTEVLRSFFDSYKEKRRMLRGLESLEQQVRKRKISRRRYKVRRRGLESRVSVLSRDLASLREKIRKAGPRYANTMRQIEAAETELEGAEAAIRRIEIRYRRRELSTETYRTQIAKYNRRRERAKTTIDGVLLRLREEIS